jgi:hypothetical protein
MNKEKPSHAVVKRMEKKIEKLREENDKLLRSVSRQSRWLLNQAMVIKDVVTVIKSEDGIHDTSMSGALRRTKFKEDTLKSVTELYPEEDK